MAITYPETVSESACVATRKIAAGDLRSSSNDLSDHGSANEFCSIAATAGKSSASPRRIVAFAFTVGLKCLLLEGVRAQPPTSPALLRVDRNPAPTFQSERAQTQESDRATSLLRAHAEWRLSPDGDQAAARPAVAP